MENFKKSIKDDENDSSDAYLADLERKLDVKRNVGLVDSAFDRDYLKNLDIGSHRMGMAAHRAKTILIYWGILFGLATNTLAVYPISVKIVRKTFKLTGFWNIHFAIIPILLNWNAVVLGLGQGLYEYYTLKS